MDGAYISEQVAADASAIVVHAGFPNPAADASLGALDIQRLLVPRPVSTFFFRAVGNAWQPLGIFDGDIAVIDRALQPRGNDIVGWWGGQGQEFALSFYRNLPPDATVWGTVTATVHICRRAV